ncbi:MerR family transcriptional regulator [Gracilibacillus salinarum]|uniref:MerR family transcriptional regulator n=1 Tax=Gracilibacillus salinarum TaxID=2932255 RepID=A0ABY4GN91_9BACI|nr:MerR family transcriptional regulator [Gracilibacillus salinarum]UOQ84817.1 MerR family transcriptional regulator [Gracilibacillus salinarum]
MKNQFLIGELAKLFQIPTSTLRYYDEIGIFQPKHKDPDSMYRYYTVDQFIVLDTIIFLKNQGFSIKDIKQHLEHRKPESIKKLLENKLDEVKKEMERLNQVSAKINHKISTIDTGLSLAANPVLEFKWFPARTISFIYNDSPINLQEDFNSLYVRDLEEISTSGIGYEGYFTGDFGNIVDLQSLYQDREVKYRAVFEVLPDDKYGHRIKLSKLNEGTYACYPHCGPYETIKSTYLYVLAELEKGDYHITGDPLEIIMLDESIIQDEQSYVTWIQIPITKSS